MTKGDGTYGSALALQVPPALIDALADAVHERLEAEGVLHRADSTPYLTVTEAADYLRCTSKQRIYDLVHRGALVPHRDGARLLFHRDALDAYLAGAATS